jgi:hypothetical protein
MKMVGEKKQKKWRKSNMTTIKTMSKETKDKIRSLEQEKILLEDMLEFENRPVQMVKIEEEIYEIEDSIRKLTA